MAVANGWPDEKSTDQWDNLRKQARKLESELDDKLVAYRKIASGPEDSKDGTEACIKDLLKSLQHVNTQMQAWVSNGGSHVLSHTLARHKDILHELTQEFARINTRAKANLEHAKLLETFGRSNKKKDPENGQNGDSSEQALLRESANISRTSGQLDSVIGQVRATLSDLNIQRSVFGDANSKLGLIQSSLPTVNSILASIRRKKSLDNIILAIVTFAKRRNPTIHAHVATSTGPKSPRSPECHWKNSLCS
ncbi:hypothetical protein Mp_1g19070 [Marchantia polymorpha subsp. ruderalis]|uniref:Golgi SNAP receptor complex member 1 n=2 Tax=Marchantia polymorpha TaxID=3197 RepID=A0AAF6ARR9_MARPO|nr:hypothetical protein MARPO_0001s0245 [Marchantia polymorpha]BBM99139.1 hypothetical protein Mp_1g19070 [Marchantia polymorpha subsp. ruderalis]|eukprot:PTQ50216.1 hypothetical protein MARPO_0001s0245 [Marchantia polymorpha]